MRDVEKEFGAGFVEIDVRFVILSGAENETGLMNAGMNC